MFILNAIDITGIRTAVRALGLTAICVVSFVATIYVAPVVITAIVAALAAVVAFIAAVVAVIAHAAAYAISMALWCGAGCAVTVVLAKVVPCLWTRRHGLLIAAKGLALAAVVAGCFVGAVMVAPLVLAVAGKALVATAVMGSAILSVKVM